jgi:hypothetical protein
MPICRIWHMRRRGIENGASLGSVGSSVRVNARQLRLNLDKLAFLGLSSRPMTDSNPIAHALDLAGYRLTAPRLAVADLITEYDGHFTALELEDAARTRRLGISRATLFRALDLLAELGVVERVDLPNGEHAYVPCARAHHHHVICSR